MQLIEIIHIVKLLFNFAGGLGQLGIECAKLLRSRWGEESVLLSDIIKPNKSICQSGPYIFADILDFKVTHQCVDDDNDNDDGVASDAQ